MALFYFDVAQLFSFALGKHCASMRTHNGSERR